MACSEILEVHVNVALFWRRSRELEHGHLQNTIRNFGTDAAAVPVCICWKLNLAIELAALAFCLSDAAPTGAI